MRFICLGILALCVCAPPLFAADGDLQLVLKEEHTVIMSPVAVALDHITKDNNLDAVVVGDVSSTAVYRCFPGVGDGTLSDYVYDAFLYLSPVDVVTGDFNGDNVTDIAAINNACE